MLRKCFIVAIPLLSALTGCAQHKLQITSEPAGALVYLNAEEVGRTPMTYDFRHYGDYDVTLRKEGYETLKTHRRVKTPLYNLPPLDLVSELFGVKDIHEWHFDLAPAQEGIADPQAIIDRGQEMKQDLRSGRFTRQPTSFPTTRAVASQADPSATQPATSALSTDPSATRPAEPRPASTQPIQE